MLDVWQNKMRMRQSHTGRPNVAEVDVRSFTANKERPVPVADFAGVTVMAIAIEHEPVEPAVAYRIDTPDGSIVISGDTAVCSPIE